MLQFSKHYRKLVVRVVIQLFGDCREFSSKLSSQSDGSIVKSGGLDTPKKRQVSETTKMFVRVSSPLGTGVKI